MRNIIWHFYNFKKPHHLHCINSFCNKEQNCTILAETKNKKKIYIISIRREVKNATDKMMYRKTAEFLLILFVSTVSSQCEPVEEGRPFSITCSGPPCREHLLYEWTAKSASMTERLISHCDTTMDCTGNNDFFTINIAKNGTIGFLSKLTINKVSRTEPFNNEGTWTCQYCGREREKCTLQIFGKIF